MMMCFILQQNSADELRMSEWSPDVCSSDLFDRFLLGRRFDNDQLHEKSVPREPLRIYAREWLRPGASVKGDLGAGRTSVNRRVPLLRKSSRGYLPTRMTLDTPGQFEFEQPQ